MKFFVGSYTSLGGPGVCLMEAQNGRLSMLSACSIISNPIYLALSADRTALYASAAMLKGAKGAAASFRLENDHLSPLCIQPAGGDEVCHVALSPLEDYLYTANYASGSVTVFPVQDGYLFPREQLLRHKGGSGCVPDRQEAAHPHQCVFRPDSTELFVCDLGKDEIVIYSQGEESGLLIHTASISTPPGCGPRHLLFLHRDCFLLVGELDNRLMRYEFLRGAWTLVQTLPTLPANCDTASFAAALRHQGERVYVSNRGHNSIAVFHLGADRALSIEAYLPVHGDFPRDILILPDGSILSAHQKSGEVEWLSSDGERIAEVSVPAAVCLLAYE